MQLSVLQLVCTVCQKACAFGRKLYADEKAKLVNRRKTQEQAAIATAQAAKPKPGVRVLLYLYMISGVRLQHTTVNMHAGLWQ